MSTALTLSTPVAYYGGTPSASLMLGYVYNNGSINCVLRYSFTTPANGYITALQLETTLRYYSGVAGFTYPIRVKVTDSETSHINAGMNTEDYDAEFDYTLTTANTTVTVPIEGIRLFPNKTYYLYLFPGSGYSTNSNAKYGQYLVFCYDNSKNDLSTLVYTAMLSGLVAIGNGGGWDVYECWIDNGESWERYIPYIDDGTGWVMCSADGSSSGGSDSGGENTGETDSLTATVSGETLTLSGGVSVSGETLVLAGGTVTGETLIL